ncbi:MAG TPA: hypothetical protein VI278_15575 [Nitrososphaeraceae archaeon]
MKTEHSRRLITSLLQFLMPLAKKKTYCWWYTSLASGANLTSQESSSLDLKD